MGNCGGKDGQSKAESGKGGWQGCLWILGKGGPGHVVAQVSSRKKKSGARQHLPQDHKIWRLNDASPQVAARGQAKYMGKTIWVGGVGAFFRASKSKSKA